MIHMPAFLIASFDLEQSDEENISDVLFKDLLGMAGIVC